MVLRLPPFARTDEFIETGKGLAYSLHQYSFCLTVNNSDIKLKCSSKDGDVTGIMSTGKDYRRLVSETKRLLLMSPSYSLTLAQIVEHFVANGDQICASTTELHHILTNTQHSFLVGILSAIERCVN